MSSLPPTKNLAPPYLKQKKQKPKLANPVCEEQLRIGTLQCQLLSFEIRVLQETEVLDFLQASI